MRIKTANAYRNNNNNNENSEKNTSSFYAFETNLHIKTCLDRRKFILRYGNKSIGQDNFTEFDENITLQLWNIDISHNVFSD